MTSGDSTDLEFRSDESSYTALQDGVLVSRIHYTVADGVVSIDSTVTDPRYRGAGLAGRLTRHALDDLRTRDRRVIPRCPYTADWIRRHPDYADLLA